MLLFLSQVFLISLTGALAPGPVTTSAIAMGARNKFAGIFMALGHMAIELPLVIILMLGVKKFLESHGWQMIIGFVGGAFLIFLAVKMALEIKTIGIKQQKSKTDKPFFAGIILSGSNPYFPLWWIGVGFNLITGAKELGAMGFVILGVVHWFCDLVWLGFLSYASFTGTKVFGVKAQKIVLAACAAVLAVFAGKFIFGAAKIFFLYF
ncbi:MAG: LysE family transporter [Sedimentisphaerales bacterium]|nr:LysE family transporter [Sedimentisphaerales bacterium]